MRKLRIRSCGALEGPWKTKGRIIKVKMEI